jgi:hypothetical protein
MGTSKDLIPAKRCAAALAALVAGSLVALGWSDRACAQISWFYVPGAALGGSSITLGPDGNLWFTDRTTQAPGRWRSGCSMAPQRSVVVRLA